MAPPVQEIMGVKFEGQGMIMKQHNSECCRCLCCQPNIDWDLHEYQVGNYNDLMGRDGKIFMKEDAPYVGRCCSYCYPGARATRFTATEGPSGRTLFTHEKSCSFPVSWLLMVTDGGPIRCPCCIAPLPSLTTKDAGGRVLGRSRYICDACLFVPKFEIQDANYNTIYRVRPDTCCLGCCVRCRCGGKKGKCLRVPFLIRSPEAPFNQVGDAIIGDLWAGLAHECCTKKNMYEIKFPTDGPMQKNPEAVMATIIGAALLIDITTFEQDG
mmetsp:Transcript_26802/g.62115  ORF Transcript_26802/g.62115 Transcript_26802/m.62115 type:complete len:269 (+) Transcript_26802:93-899(+)